MPFNSLAFLLFVAVVFAAYWALRRSLQNVLVVVASYAFYAWWDWRFLGLIVASSAVDFIAGGRLAASPSVRGRRTWLGLSLAVNLGILGVCKYLGFFVASAGVLLETLGLQPHLPTLQLILPVGISFYTFQTLSYTIDIYRGKLEPTRDPVAFFAFVAFFPQLVAGPIERASHLLGQFEADRAFDPERAKDGARQVLYGFFLKLVVADNLASVVDVAYGTPDAVDPWTLLWATYAFAFQIYGDFAGYSHIAIGCARWFGFDLRANFATPYFARSPAEFWHRWHISLSTWFRDYVYIPLGGNRVGPLRRRLNVVLTFVISGLWHGAGVTFVVWGLIHGLMVALQWWPPRTDLGDPAKPGRHRAVGVFLTFQAVSLAWVFFRSPDLATAWTVCGQLASLPASAFVGPDAIVAALIVALVALEWTQRRAPHPLRVAALPAGARWGIYLLFCFAIALVGRTDGIPFIYFQF